MPADSALILSPISFEPKPRNVVKHNYFKSFLNFWTERKRRAAATHKRQDVDGIFQAG